MTAAMVPNKKLLLTSAVAAQGVLRPPCLLSGFAAEFRVGRSQSARADETSTNSTPPTQAMTTALRRQVPETVAGFGYQFERALLHLARCASSDSMVGIETEDDVTVKQPNGAGINEQDKLSYAETGHPFQDRGIALWKTIDGWLAAARYGTEHQRRAELHLVTNRPVPHGCLARRLALPGKNAEDVEACIRDLRTIAGQPSETIEKYALNVSKSTDVELTSLIARIRLADASDGTGSSDMRQEVASALHLPPDVDAPIVIQSLHGWLAQTVQDLWRQHQPGWVSRQAFDAQYHAVLHHLKRRRSRERADRLVPVCPTKRDSAKGQGFVARLVEIDLPSDEIDEAIDCYLRHSTENWRLAQLGEYTPDDWSDFYDQLQDRWRHIRLRVRRMAEREGWAAEVHGRGVLEETTYHDFCGALAGETTTYPYFTRGGYHRLADEDQVWWSPDYTPNTSPAEEDE